MVACGAGRFAPTFWRSLFPGGRLGGNSSPPDRTGRRSWGRVVVAPECWRSLFPGGRLGVNSIPHDRTGRGMAADYEVREATPEDAAEIHALAGELAGAGGGAALGGGGRRA